MIELGEFARRGRLSEHLNRYFPPEIDGLSGVAVGYDGALVHEAVRVARLMAPGWLGTFEFSRIVAHLLEGVGRRIEGDGERIDAFPGEIDGLIVWWKSHARRLGHAGLSPIFVEATLRPERGFYEGFSPFSRGPSGEGRVTYRTRWRRAKRAKLQRGVLSEKLRPAKFSSAGPQMGIGYGTLGGFLVDPLRDQVFGLSAQHVCAWDGGLRTRCYFPAASPMVRAGADAVRWSLRWALRPAQCATISGSPPAHAPGPRCEVSTPLSHDGLDAALLGLHDGHRLSLRPVETASVGSISQHAPLSFNGARSGLQAVKVSLWSVWQSYALVSGQEACVRDCIQIQLRERPYVRSDVSQGGDSGSWVLAQGLDGLHWVGMLIGGDGERAGIVPAARLIDYFSQKTGYVLTPAIQTWA